MRPLRDPRHEKVAQLLALGKSSEEASREAGYRDGTSFADTARKRSHRPEIRARVAEIQSKEAELVAIDVAWIRRKTAEVAGVDLPPKAIKASDKVAALNLLARMTPGALVPQKIAETNPEGDGPPLAPEISDTERAVALAAFFARQKNKSETAA